MKEEVLPINILRFFAALGVLFVHKLEPMVVIGYIPKIFYLLVPYVHYGYLGVNLFFLISGFVITFSSEGRTVGQFISARFIRLFPVFWVCVSITSIVVLLLSKTQSISLAQYFANMTMMPHLFGEYDFIDGSYWTLVIEMRFYFVIAILLLIRAFVKVSFQKIALLLTVPLFYSVFYSGEYPIPFIGTALLKILYFFGAEYAQYFIAGILFYGIYENRKRYLNYVGLILCYLVAVEQAVNSTRLSENPQIIVGHVAVFFGIFLLISTRIVTNNSCAFLGKHYKKISTILGAITYPLYLLHSNIMGTLSVAMPKDTGFGYFIGGMIIFLVVLLVLLVNKIDRYASSLWKQSSYFKAFLIKTKMYKRFPFLERVF